MEPSVLPSDAVVVAVSCGWIYYLSSDDKIHMIKQK